MDSSTLEYCSTSDYASPSSAEADSVLSYCKQQELAEVRATLGARNPRPLGRFSRQPLAAPLRPSPGGARRPGRLPLEAFLKSVEHA